MIPGSQLIGRVLGDVDRHALRARNGLRHLVGHSFVDVGVSPRRTVWSRDSVELWHYESTAPTGGTVLLVPSLLNRSYIFDLHPGNSFVEHLLAAGIDVFMLDWGDPTPADADNTLETYIHNYLAGAIAAAAAEAGTDELTVVGYCFGGILALLYAATHPASGVGGVVCLGTPVDFAHMGLMVAMIREGKLEIDDVLDDDGHVPGDIVRRLIELRRPTGRLALYVNLVDNLWNDRYMAGYQAMNRWTTESVPLPGAVARQVTNLLVRENRLMDGGIMLGGRDVDLASITIPFLIVLGEHDDMVPLAASSPLRQLLTGAPVDELRLPTGHLSLVAGRRAAKETIPRIIEWVQAR